MTGLTLSLSIRDLLLPRPQPPSRFSLTGKEVPTLGTGPAWKKVLACWPSFF